MSSDPDNLLSLLGGGGLPSASSQQHPRSLLHPALEGLHGGIGEDDFDKDLTSVLGGMGVGKSLLSVGKDGRVGRKRGPKGNKQMSDRLGLHNMLP